MKGVTASYQIAFVHWSLGMTNCQLSLRTIQLHMNTGYCDNSTVFSSEILGVNA